MKYFKYFTALILIIIFALPVFAHPGSTDEYGGHVEYETGEYHYHHGYSAHQHTNGVCPYDFVDNADHSNHGITSSNSYNYNYDNRDQYVPAVQYTLKPAPTPTPKLSIQNKPSKQKDNSLLILIFSGLLVAIYYRWIKNREEKAKQTLIAQQKFEEEKAKYTQLYGGKDICQLAKVPADIIFDEKDLPHQYKPSRNQLSLYDTKTDNYTVYISLKANSSLYHRSPKCLKNPHEVNYYYAWYKNLKPCKKCKPTTDDMQWYREYTSIKHIKEKYNIE